MHELTKSEKDFFAILFDEYSEVKSILMDLPDFNYADNKKYFLLGHFIQNAIETAQKVISFLDDECLRIKFLASVNAAVLSLAVEHYEEIHSERPSKNFTELLHKIFYEATCLNYKIQLDYVEKLEVVDAIIGGLSLSRFQDRLNSKDRASKQAFFDSLDGYLIRTISKLNRALLEPVSLKSGIYLYRVDISHTTYAWVIHDNKQDETLNLTKLDLKKKYTNIWNDGIDLGFREFILSNCKYPPIDKPKLEKISSQIQKRNKEMFESYKKATEPVPGYIFPITGVFTLLALFCLLVEPTVAVFIMTIAGITIGYEKFYREPHKPRNMTTKTQNEYIRLLPEHFDRKSLSPEVKSIKKQALSCKATREEKAQASLSALYDYLCDQKSLKKSRLLEEGNKKILQQKITGTNTEDVFLYSENYLNKNEWEIRIQIDENLKNLKKLYPRYKKEVKGLEKTKKLPDEISYQKIAYRLSPALKNQGCLAQVDNSCAYFDLGKFDNKVDNNILENFKQNKYVFGSKKGSFGIFKHVNSDQYRLKLADGRHIDFELENNVEITADDETHKSVPRYVAVRYGHK